MNRCLLELRAAVDANPLDWVLRRIFADALEEQNLIEQALGQRYQAEQEKAPVIFYPYGVIYTTTIIWGQVNNEGWLRDEYYGQPRTAPLVAQEIFALLCGRVAHASIPWHFYGTIEEAEQDLARVLSRMRRIEEQDEQE